MTTTIQIPTDQITKMRAQQVALGLGIPLDKLMSGYLKEVANQHVELPTRRMSKKLERILGAVKKDFKAGKNISGPFKNAQEAIAHLNSL